jgi:hypothetical protein
MLERQIIHALLNVFDRICSRIVALAELFVAVVLESDPIFLLVAMSSLPVRRIVVLISGSGRNGGIC